jgi:hypothetical protein
MTRLLGSRQRSLVLGRNSFGFLTEKLLPLCRSLLVVGSRRLESLLFGVGSRIHLPQRLCLHL